MIIIMIIGMIIIMMMMMILMMIRTASARAASSTPPARLGSLPLILRVKESHGRATVAVLQVWLAPARPMQQTPPSSPRSPGRQQSQRSLLFCDCAIYVRLMTGRASARQSSLMSPSIKKKQALQGALKGTDLRWQTGPKTQMFAEYFRYSQRTAGNRRLGSVTLGLLA